MKIGKSVFLLCLLILVGWIGWLIYQQLQDQNQETTRQDRGSRVVPVEVEEITRGQIDEVRTFSGTLDASKEFVVASKVSGRIEIITVDLSDSVDQGQIIVKLDNAEYQQAVTQAKADLAVATANLKEAESLLKIAARELARVETLQKRGVSSESEQDTARANQLARGAHLEVTKAQLTRAMAEVETARIRLGYSDVAANWQGDSTPRIVAERYVNEGETVSVNQPLLRIVKLNQVIAVFHVSERDYGLLAPQQTVNIETDAYPNQTFEGRITRIAPVFRESTRQARVEILVENPDARLKPGMFVRSRVILKQVSDAVILPQTALVVRDGQTGVFVLDPQKPVVHWQVIEPGIRHNNYVEAVSGELKGSVVTLGQQLLDDGSEVIVQLEKTQ